MLDKNLPQKGDVVASKYQIDRLLGSGGMGAVYQVTHRVTGKAFAIKWLLPRLSAETDAVQRFIREAQVAGRVDHPNIVEVYDVGQEGDTFYMVMELLHGESLAQRLAAKGRLSAAEICQILIPVTRGLEAAHRAGVIHRDLKPDNIFLCRNEDGSDMPKLLDFGISKVSELTGEVSSNITRQGAIMGTPFYMAPEQMRGHGVDARTDVYALGVILYQALGGELPFTGDTFADLLLKIVSTDPKPLATLAPDAPRALVEVVERALSRDQAARVPTAAALGQQLQQFVTGVIPGSLTPAPVASLTPAPGLTTQTPLATSFRPAVEQRPGNLRFVPLAAVALLGLGVAGWLALQPSAATPQAAGLQQGDELRLVRPLPVQPVLKPEVQQQEAEAPLPPTDTVRLDTPAAAPDAGVAPPPAEPIAQLPAAVDPLPPPAEKPLKKKKKVDDLFAPTEQADTRGPRRTVALGVDDFLAPAPAPAKRDKPKPPPIQP